MDWIDEIVDALTATKEWGYHAGAPSATEPVALAALALVAHGRHVSARPLTDWLIKHRNADTGSVEFPTQVKKTARLLTLGGRTRCVLDVAGTQRRTIGRDIVDQTACGEFADRAEGGVDDERIALTDAAHDLCRAVCE